MGRRVHIAHVDRQADESQHVRAGVRAGGQQPLCHRTLFRFPREAGAHIDRLNRTGRVVRAA